MREKYRAWDTETNTWVEGIEFVIHTSGRVLIVPEHVILMWSIGFKDRHGKEAYDGDILELNCLGWGEMYKAKAVVTYENFRWLFHMIEKPEGIEWIPIEHKWEPESEIIGNIKEQPELVQRQ